jgi:fructosamine-3-kinase
MDEDARTRLARLLGGPVTDGRRLGAQHGVIHYQLQLPAGRRAFAKVAALDRTGLAQAGGAGAADPVTDGGAAGLGFAAEASGLAWLAAAGAVAVPAVLGWDERVLVLDWVPPGEPDQPSAARFGRELAALHGAGADRYGAPWPGTIAGLPLPNAADAAPPGAGWGEWYAAARLLPYVRLARDAGTLTAADAGVLESAAMRAPAVAGPAEPPSRIHGDCWSGNVLWSGGRGWLVDPAAHGGHRETDLAMLALFGTPELGEILAAYQEAAPLADGWRARVSLHQLHPLLVHVCLFGDGYVAPALAAARAALAL